MKEYRNIWCLGSSSHPPKKQASTMWKFPNKKESFFSPISMKRRRREVAELSHRTPPAQQRLWCEAVYDKEIILNEQCFSLNSLNCVLCAPPHWNVEPGSAVLVQHSDLPIHEFYDDTDDGLWRFSLLLRFCLSFHSELKTLKTITICRLAAGAMKKQRNKSLSHKLSNTRDC